jgi:hypothetical protein
MQKMSQLKQIREQMMEELTQIPQYRALKAIDRFMGEIVEIYGPTQALPGANVADDQEKSSSTHDSRARDGGAVPLQKITPYIPAHRVA